VYGTVIVQICLSFIILV